MQSVWTKSVDLKSFDELVDDISTDTVIIGGGITGILTSMLLNENGIKNIVIEANEICSGQTKNTTAKITSQHGEIYNKIEKYYGSLGAREYALANESAILEYERIIREKNIDCDFEKQTAYLYTKNAGSSLTTEFESAKKAGIDCFFQAQLDLPFKTMGAIGFRNQAQFNPLKFINAIVKDLTIYEHTPAIKIKNKMIYTPRARIKAKHIVIATHYPFINFPALYFLRMSCERSYVIGIERKDIELNGMYIGIDDNTLSLRSHQDLILLGGCSHRTGSSLENNCFSTLSSRASSLYPNHKELYQWSAQDCITLDGLPYIGRFGGKDSNIYIATGFNKWGMSTSMLSAKIISDLICEKDNEYSNIFSPRRFSFNASVNNICYNTIETVKGFASHLKAVKTDDYYSIPKNSAKEIVYNGKKVGAYKDDDGTVYLVSLVCPHLKCKLNWNDTTKTWDCPCHGSRYNYTGELIDNPAQSSSILIEKKKTT